MFTLQSPVMEKHMTLRKTGRKPLQPINTISPNVPPQPINTLKPNPKLGLIEIISNGSSNKENPNPNSNKQNEILADPVQFEVSLADELSAIREKMERLRSDKEKTEKMLRERDLVMEMKLKEIHQRGEIQKVLEMEVDRLYRLNELKSLCNMTLPIKSLREKEYEKIKPDKAEVTNQLIDLNFHDYSYIRANTDSVLNKSLEAEFHYSVTAPGSAQLNLDGMSVFFKTAKHK